MLMKGDFVLFIGVCMANLLLEISSQGSVLSKCREVVFSCSCGVPGYQFQAIFKQCHYWFPKEEACTRFQHCLECESDSKRCVSCPSNRYGNQCAGICNCKPGEICQRDTGQCICSSGSCGKPDTPSIVIPDETFCPETEREFIHGEIKYIVSKAAIRRNIGGKQINTYPPNSIISYSCQELYELHGVSKRQCQSDGEWSGIQPRCKPECGVSANKIPFIINGTKAELGEWPWQVALAYSTGFIFCGGSLVSEVWVITAAHCVTLERKTTLRPTSDFRIFFGKYSRTSNENVQEREVERLIIHGDYNPINLDTDIALILVKPIKLTFNVRPVCLTNPHISSRNLEAGNIGVVTGWGDEENGKPSDILKKTNLSVIQRQVCEITNHGLQITNNMFCAGVPNSYTDTCRGDSGGPMVFSTLNSGKLRWFLEGIVSWGVDLGCATPNMYSGFTKVSNFRDWIDLYVPL